MNSTAPSPIRVLLADDHAVWRSGVRTILEQEGDIVVVGEAAGGDVVPGLYLRCQPDIVLLDLRMPGLDGVEIVRQIRASDPKARVIVLTTFDTDEDINLAFRAGAMAYLLKDLEAESLVRCVREVAAGRIHVPPAVAAKLAEKIARVQLTVRELTVLRLVSQGLSNKEIAQNLQISDGTVKVHLRHLFEKLEAGSRTEAIFKARQRGLIRYD